MRHLRTYRAPLLVGGLALLFACSSDSTPTGGDGNPSTGTVSVVDNAFVPGAVTILRGQTVGWRWNGRALHNVTFDDASIGNSPTQENGSFERTFPDAGEFTYFCTVHGRALMSGKVTVSGG